MRYPIIAYFYFILLTYVTTAETSNSYMRLTRKDIINSISVIVLKQQLSQMN